MRVPVVMLVAGVVTLSVDQVIFKEPIYVGELVTFWRVLTMSAPLRWKWAYA